MSAHHIRNATAKDAEAIAPLLTQLGFPATIASLRERLSQMSEDVLVADEKGHIIGVICLSQMQVLHRPHPVGRVSALVVDQDFRGQGVGASLLAAAESELRNRGCGMVEITSNFKLEPAHEFYRRQAYEATSYRFKKDLVACNAVQLSA